MRLTNTVIHGLDGGFALCGFSNETPKNWSEEHRWTEVTDHENMTCPQCKDIAERRQILPQAIETNMEKSV